MSSTVEERPAFAPSDSPLPPGMFELSETAAPAAPLTLKDCGVDRAVLTNLMLKLAHTVPKLNTEWAAQRLCLPLPIAGELLEELRRDQLVETLGQSGPFSYHFAITRQGRERATRLMEMSGYVGPAPVALSAYRQLLEWQFTYLATPTPEQVNAAFENLILPKEVVQVAGLAIQSRRSLFLYGPAGNGKTTVGHLLHNAVQGDLWIPHCIGVDDNIVRIYDPQCHQSVEVENSIDAVQRVDRRWVRIRRPFIVVGGELTVDALDLIYSDAHGYYEAPLHMKANGGTFLLDDFGCQRDDPEKLLNRWIYPLEQRVDYLTLQTGQKIEVPFRQMLVISTNLDLDKVMTPAVLRRIGYRIFLDNATPERFSQILRRYASSMNVDLPQTVIDELLGRYRKENRPLRSCEPRDLIERARDICRYDNRSLRLDSETMDLAWKGYFGAEPSAPSDPS